MSPPALASLILAQAHIVGQIEDRALVSRLGEWHHLAAFDCEHVGAGYQGVGEFAISRAAVLIVLNEAARADVQHDALAEAPGHDAEERFGINELSVEGGQVEDVETPALLHQLHSDGGEAARVGHALGEFRAEGERVGEFEHVRPAPPEVVDQTAIGELVATPRGSPRLRDRAAIGDPRGARTQRVSH